MKNKLIIILFVVGIFMGIILSVFISKGGFSQEKPIQDNIVENQDPANGVKEETPSSEVTGDYEAPHDPSNPEVNDSLAISAENEIRTLFREYKYTEGTARAKEIIDSYDITKNPKSEIIETLYYEGSLLIHLANIDVDGVINVVKGLKDPENTLLAVLSSHVLARPEVILDEDSLNPVSLETPIIISKELETGYARERAEVLYPDMQYYHKIIFEIEGNRLEAYVIQYPDGYCRLHRIVTPEGETNYFATVKKYKETLERIQKSENN